MASRGREQEQPQRLWHDRGLQRQNFQNLLEYQGFFIPGHAVFDRCPFNQNETKSSYRGAEAARRGLDHLLRPYSGYVDWQSVLRWRSSSGKHYEEEPVINRNPTGCEFGWWSGRGHRWQDLARCNAERAEH